MGHAGGSAVRQACHLLLEQERCTCGWGGAGAHDNTFGTSAAEGKQQRAAHSLWLRSTVTVAPPTIVDVVWLMLL